MNLLQDRLWTTWLGLNNTLTTATLVPCSLGSGYYVLCVCFSEKLDCFTDTEKILRINDIYMTCLAPQMERAEGPCEFLGHLLMHGSTRETGTRQCPACLLQEGSTE